MLIVININLDITSIHGIFYAELTHSGQVTHICVSDLATIGSDNGLLRSWRQAIIWTNV